MPDPLEPAAQVEDQLGVAPQAVAAESDADPASPSDNQPSTPPAASEQPQVTAEERNRRAEEGRRRASLENVIRQQNDTIGRLEKQVGQIGEYVNRDAKARREAYLASLPPEQRAAKMIELQQQEIDGLKRRLDGPQDRTTTARSPQPVNGEDPAIARARQIARNILDEVNGEFDTALTGNEDGVDWTDPKTFRASIRAIAVSTGRATPPAKEPAVAKAKEDAKSADAGKVDLADLVKQISGQVVQQVREDLGISGSNSVRAAGGVAAASSESDLQRQAEAYDTRTSGPRAQAKQYQAALDAALAGAKK